MKWYAKRDSDSDGQGLIVAEADGFARTVAVVYDANDMDLIAAAPELAEALRELLVETNQHATGDCPKLKAACKTASDALKKAGV